MMCNRIHHDAVPIPESGIGYKIFNKNLGFITPLFAKDRAYKNVHKDGFVSWDADEFAYVGAQIEDGFGFCFFLDRKVAVRLFNRLKAYDRKSKKYGEGQHYDTIVIYRIKYEQGLGEHIEDNIVERGTFKTSICKRFKITNLPKGVTM